MGNQMFQYAAGRHLAIKNNTELKLDTSIMLDWSPGRHTINRDFDLTIFQLKPQKASRKDIAPYNPQLMSKPEKVLFHLKKKLGISPVFREKYFQYDPELLQLKGTQYLAGLWQSYKYFEEISEVIRKDFTFNTSPDHLSIQLLSQISQTNSICLSVRRSDYVSHKQTADMMGFVGVDYFNKAFEILKNKISNPHLYIFSDDIVWCRENLNIPGYPVFYVDGKYAGEKFSSYLQLMTACKHFIIPNSTFPWWAAWLSINENKIVCAPRNWFADKSIDTNDLIPDSWIRV